MDKLLRKIKNRTNEHLNRIQQPERRYIAGRHAAGEDYIRARLSIIVVLGFMLIIPGVFLFVYFYNQNLPRGVSPIDLERILSIIGTIFAGLLGFILGYYFKGHSQGKEDK